VAGSSLIETAEVFVLKGQRLKQNRFRSQILKGLWWRTNLKGLVMESTQVVMSKGIRVLFGFNNEGSPNMRCLKILEADKVLEQKACCLAELLLEVDIGAVETLTTGAIMIVPEIAPVLAEKFIKVFIDNRTISQFIGDEARRVHNVLLGFLCAELGLDMERARPGLIVAPHILLSLGYMRGAKVLPMSLGMSGRFANHLAQYFGLTVACGTDHRAHFAATTAACCAEAEQLFIRTSPLSTLLQQVAVEIGQKSQKLFLSSPSLLSHWLHGVAIGLEHYARVAEDAFKYVGGEF